MSDTLIAALIIGALTFLGSLAVAIAYLLGR